MDIESKLLEIDQRLGELDKRVAAVSTTQKDIWDRFSQIGPILITLAVAAGGWVVTDLMKRMDVNATQRQIVMQETTSRMSTRVSQAQLVSTFLNPLLGNDPDAQKLAIKALLIALPEEGPDLVQTLSSTTDDSDIKQFAEAALDDGRSNLVDELFSADDDLRSSAQIELAHGWVRDPQLVADLLTAARENMDNIPAINAALSVLYSMDAGLLSQHKPEIESLVGEDKDWDASTKHIAEQLRSKLASNP
jgi:hypothetical protein